MLNFIKSWSDALNFDLHIYGIALVGLVLMLVIFRKLRAYARKQSSGTLNYADTVGQIATVCSTVSPVQRAGGQIEVMIQGCPITAEALQKGSQPLLPGTKVKVVGMIGSSTLMVQPLD